MALWSIFKVYTQQDIGYDGTGWRRFMWWWQTTEDSQLRVTLEYILA